jgi:predicted O-methyltransferase YrrM
MSVAEWHAVDDYIGERLVRQDAVLEAALKDSDAAGLPAISVSAAHGKLLHLLARLQNAKRILEIGTLGGYSTIWLARALAKEGRLISLEAEPRHAEVARANIARAGLADRIEIRVGLALETLPKLAGEAIGPFDLFFIDADKENNAEYFAWAVKLSRPGSLILVDNVGRNGKIADAASTDPRVQGVRRLFDAVAAEPRVSATALQTVGVKGYDGLAVILVTA